jgi:hypothetical protein
MSEVFSNVQQEMGKAMRTKNKWIIVVGLPIIENWEATFKPVMELVGTTMNDEYTFSSRQAARDRAKQLMIDNKYWRFKTKKV